MKNFSTSALAALALCAFPAFAAADYTCYATDSDGITYSASGSGSQDRVQQDALDECKAQTVSHGCRRAGCELSAEFSDELLVE
jgi:hypothetical protein